MGNTVVCNGFCGDYFVLGEETEEYHRILDTGLCSNCQAKLNDDSDDGSHGHFDTNDYYTISSDELDDYEEYDDD
ncbi:hypothetical protein [Priestia koreensis]|uniref:hypothetical protein n=1 Tax=Priestia koreensis TaxID=284581 RepID=UPI00301770C4